MRLYIFQRAYVKRSIFFDHLAQIHLLQECLRPPSADLGIKIGQSENIRQPRNIWRSNLSASLPFDRSIYTNDRSYGQTDRHTHRDLLIIRVGYNLQCWHPVKAYPLFVLHTLFCTTCLHLFTKVLPRCPGKPFRWEPKYSKKLLLKELGCLSEYLWPSCQTVYSWRSSERLVSYRLAASVPNLRERILYNDILRNFDFLFITLFLAQTSVQFYVPII